MGHSSSPHIGHGGWNQGNPNTLPHRDLLHWGSSHNHTASYNYIAAQPPNATYPTLVVEMSHFTVTRTHSVLAWDRGRLHCSFAVVPPFKLPSQLCSRC